MNNISFDRLTPEASVVYRNLKNYPKNGILEKEILFTFVLPEMRV